MARSATIRGRVGDLPPARGLFLRRVRVVLEDPSHKKLKRHLLGRLLRVFELEGEVAAFWGEEPAESRVRSDLGEVLALHLRALYETTPHEQRAARLLEEFVALRGICTARAGLQAIMNADAEPLEDLERFLPGWIEALRRLEPDRDDSPWNLRGPLF